MSKRVKTVGERGREWEAEARWTDMPDLAPGQTHALFYRRVRGKWTVVIVDKDDASWCRDAISRALFPIHKTSDAQWQRVPDPE